MKRPFRKRKRPKPPTVSATRLPSRTYGFVRARELEGTYPGPPNIGTWINTTQRIGKGWGYPPDAAWPYDPDNWPPEEPPGVDAIATKDRTTAYMRCRTLDDCRSVLKQGGGVLAAFQIDASWIGSDGYIADPREHTPQATHSILLVGCNDAEEMLDFLHSWGPFWGGDGLGHLPYRYWTDRLLEAWIPDSRNSDAPTLFIDPDTVVKIAHASDWWGRRIHLIEIEKVKSRKMVGWAILIETEHALELEELFIRPTFRQAGHGRALAAMVEDLRAQLDLPLRSCLKTT